MVPNDRKLVFHQLYIPSDWSIALFITDVTNISIFESAFLYNHGDESHVGDNVILLLDSCSSPGNNTAVSLNIILVHLLSFMKTFPN